MPLSSHMDAVMKTGWLEENTGILLDADAHHSANTGWANLTTEDLVWHTNFMAWTKLMTRHLKDLLFFMPTIVFLKRRLRKISVKVMDVQPYPRDFYNNSNR